MNDIRYNNLGKPQMVSGYTSEPKQASVTNLIWHKQTNVLWYRTSKAHTDGDATTKEQQWTLRLFILRIQMQHNTYIHLNDTRIDTFVGLKKLIERYQTKYGSALRVSVC